LFGPTLYVVLLRYAVVEVKPQDVSHVAMLHQLRINDAQVTHGSHYLQRLLRGMQISQYTEGPYKAYRLSLIIHVDELPSKSLKVIKMAIFDKLCVCFFLISVCYTTSLIVP